MFKTKYEFLFLGKDEDSFVENYAYDLGEGGDSAGKVFVNLEIQQNAFDAEKVGQIIFDVLRKSFFADLEADPYERFEDALKEVNRSLNSYKQERDNDFLGKLHVIIAAIVGDQLLITQTGDAEAYLIRKRLSTTISEGLDEESEKETFTNIASGELEAGDSLLLCTTRLLRYISKKDLATLVSSSDLSERMLELKEQLHGEVLTKVGMIGIDVDKQNPGEVKMAGKDNFTLHEKEESYRDFSGKAFQDEKAIPGKLNTSLAGKKIKAKAIDIYNKLRNGVKGVSKKINDSGSASNSAWSKDKILIGIIALVIILVIGLLWLRSKGEEDKRINELSDTLVSIREEINSAVTTGQFAPDRAGEILNSAEQKAIEVYNSGYHKAKARELLDLILETRDQLDGVIRLEPDKMADLAEKRSNVDALGLVYSSDQLFAYEYNALYPISGEGAEDPLTIDENENVVSAVNYDDQDSVLFFTESDKLIEYKDDRMTFLTTTDEGFKDAVEIDSYSNKIYLLSPSEGELFRYTRRRDRFDTAESYSIGADLSNAVDLAIDGNVYVLKDNGEIIRLYQGAKEDFVIQKGPSKELLSPTKIFTEADMAQIYVLEPDENRVLVYIKDSRINGAVYENQYVFDELQDLKDIYVDKDTNTMYLLTANAVYRVGL
ncbi:hypothetical protein GF376_04245 [Candidatus Peregrinibacteria bacterium]|nr:hypothetical protein [Candidatus Peregrinibacteria bacterium]